MSDAPNPIGRPIRVSVILCSTALGIGIGPAARAQFVGDQPSTAVLPATGYSQYGGGLRDQIERLSPGGGSSLTPGLRITPSIGVDLGVTDNPNGLDTYTNGNSSGPDGFVIVSPAIQVSGETSRVRVNLGYAPTLTQYFTTSNQNTISQNGYGSANITVVPDAIYIAASGSVSEQPRTGGTFYNAQQGLGTSTLNRNDETQTYSFAVTPYAVHRFGGTGSAQIGYTFAYTSANAQDGNFYDGGSVLNNQSYNGRYASTQPLITNRAFANFTTGEDFGRFNSITAVQATQFSGDGVYSNAYRNTFLDDLSYALTRSVAVIARIGYENVRYSGTPSTKIDDVVWRAGVRLTPNPSSQVTIAYGHSDGFDSAYVSGFYTPTARSRIDVSYSSGLTTDLEDIQNTTIISQYDPSGSAFNQYTAGPISSGSGFYGIDNNLFRLRRASATGSLIYDRDTYALTITNEHRTIVSASASQYSGLIGSTDDGTTGTLTWDHQLSPVLTSSASGSIGTDRISGSGGGNQTTYGAFAGLFWTLTPTLTASARYSFLKRTGTDTSLSGFNQGSRSGTVNTFVVGMRKTF